ncbi:MAG: SulP family inorganic anion transporter [Bacteriovoracales bacterium]
MFNTENLLKDLKASVVVFLVALPLCLGISLASEAPLFSGILAGIIGGIIIGFLSKSHTSVSGPAAGLTVIVLTAAQTLGDFYTLTLAVMIGGILQILFGLFRAGKIGGYFPNSVIKGMLAAIGLILILKQFPHLLGFDSTIIGDDAFVQKDKLNTFSTIVIAVKNLNWAALIISVLSLVIMIFWEIQAKKGKKIFNFIPGALVSVLAGILINEFLFSKSSFFFLAKEHLVILPNEKGLSSFFATFRMPNWDAITNPLVYKSAFTLAIVASLETLLSVEAVDKLDPHKRVSNKNQELMAQGAGNIISGLIGGLPVTSVIVRSSANIASGGATKLTSIMHGFWLFLAVVFIPRFLELIPLASLAAVLILVGYKLCTPSLFKEMLAKGKQQFIPFIVTILAILFTDLLIGILIGLVVGFIFVIISSSSKSIVLVNNKSDYLIRFLKDVSFLNKPVMKKLLDGIPNNSSLIIDGSNPVDIDNDIIVIIEEFLEVCKERNIDCEIIKESTAINPFFKS